MEQDKSTWWGLYNPDYPPKPWYRKLWSWITGGDKRHVDIPKDFYKELNWEVKIDPFMEIIRKQYTHFLDEPDITYEPIEKIESLNIETLQAPNVASK